MEWLKRAHPHEHLRATYRKRTGNTSHHER